MSTSSAKNFCVTFPGDKHPHKPDFTICGGGTTALCLANSLSSKGYRVLVLEAGKDHSDNPIVQNPFELSTYYDGTPLLNIVNTAISPDTTNYIGNAQGNSFGCRIETLTSGAGVGGGGLHWVLEYVTFTPQIIDGPLQPNILPPNNTSTYSFVDAAGPKWSYPTLRSYVKANENFRQISGQPGLTESPNERGYSGPTTVLQLQPYPPMGPPAIVQNALSGASTTIPGGVLAPVVEDYNLPQNINSVSQIQNYLSLELKRQNSVTSFANDTVVEKGPDNSLIGIGGRKLIILSQRLVVRAIPDNNKCGRGKYVAKGVEFLYENVLYRVKSKNVVASMGAGYSPGFWMRSGFGSDELLQPLGIPKQVDMPLLGMNLQNQYGASMLISTSNPVYSQAFLGQAFVQQNNVPRRFQVIHAGFGPFPIGAIEPQPYLDPSRYYFYLIGFLLQPRSRGYVKILTSNVGTQPNVQWNFFGDGPVPWQPASGLSDPDSDISVSCDMLQYMYETLLRMKVASPDDDFALEFLPCSLFEGAPKEERYQQMVPWLQMFAKAASHESGTVVMNSDPSKGCVDENLKMHGTKNCFTCDSSITPVLNSGNTGILEQAIGLRAGDLIPTVASL